VQDVLLALTRALPGFEYQPDKGKFRSYLKTVTLHAIFRRGNRRRGEVDMEPDALPPPPDDEEVEKAWEAEWRQYHLRRAMGQIAVEFNDTDREAFQRYALEGHSVRETAEALDLSVDQVYQAKSRIMKRLSGLIEQQIQEDG